MRKIENPVPMYARDAKSSNLAIPEEGKELGFDLIEFDWVPSYGKGKVADFIFNLKSRFSGMRDYESRLTLKFSNKNDGIIKITENFDNGSEFKLPRFAPKNGYINEIIFLRSRHKGGITHENYNYNDSYIFRVRSKQNEGEEIQGMYGKIRGPIVLEPRVKPADLNFEFYLNPDGTRNLEFDPKRNLFGDLPVFEQVTKP